MEQPKSKSAKPHCVTRCFTLYFVFVTLQILYILSVMTRSRAAKKTPATGGATKKPFLRLSNTPDGNKGNGGGGGGNRNSGQFATPPPSPTKSPQPPRSPPTPHKIKVLNVQCQKLT